jgi:hypothetical protein
MTDDELDQQLRDSVLAENVDLSRLEAIVRQQLRLRPRYLPRWTAIAAGLAAMALAGLTSYRSFVKEENTPVTCIAAAHDHQNEIVKGEPRVWSRDLAGVASLAQKEGVPESALAALSGAGYRLARGRLCFLQGQIYLHLVYHQDGEAFSVYLRRRSKQPLFRASVRETSIGMDNVAYFQTRDLNVVFVAQAPSGDVLAFAQAGLRALKPVA